MARIFLNYRRKDEPGYVQALYEKLQGAFPGRVYMDVDGAIEPGDDFVEMLRQRVAESDVVLAAIGPKWLSELNARDEPTRDYVVIEIRLAFELGKRVIPVLLHEARMPPPEALPEAIRKLSQRHAFSLRSERFGADCAGLVDTLQRRLQKDAEARRAAEQAREQAERRGQQEAEQKAAEAKARARAEDVAQQKAAFEAVEVSGGADGYHAYLERWPNGAYAGRAKRALRRLSNPPSPLGVGRKLSLGAAAAIMVGFVLYLQSESPKQHVADSEGDVQSPVQEHDERAAEVPDDSAATAGLQPDSPGFTRPTWAIEHGTDSYGRWATFEVTGVRQKMRWLPAGTFMMGSPESEEGRDDDEGAQHQVTLSHGLWLADTECTQALWEAVTGDKPSRFKGDARPVETVSWNDARTFLAKLNRRVPSLHARLPTEAEWEYAARAGTTAARYSELDGVAWYNENSGSETHPVGQKQPNAWGLYDMLGNVWEWTSDTAYRRYGPAPVSDPSNEAGDDRVVRGGAWLYGTRFCRAACRNRIEPGLRYDVLGFRLARGPVPVRPGPWVGGS